MKVIDGGFGKKKEEEEEVPGTLHEHLEGISELVKDIDAPCDKMVVVAYTDAGVVIIGFPSDPAEISFMLSKAQIALIASGE